MQDSVIWTLAPMTTCKRDEMGHSADQGKKVRVVVVVWV